MSLRRLELGLLVLFVLASLGGWHLLAGGREELLELQIGIMQEDLEIQALLLEEALVLARQDARILTGIPPVKILHRFRESSPEHAVWRERMEKIFFSIATSRDYLREIEYIDETGRERIGVFSRGKSAYVERGRDLEFYGGEEWFVRAMETPVGSAFVSDPGPDPRGEMSASGARMMLRISSPLVDEETLERKGLIVLQIDLEELIRDLPGARDALSVAERTGGYLHHPDPARKSAGRSPSRGSLFLDHPGLVAKMGEEIFTGFVPESDHIDGFIKMRPAPGDPGRYWILHLSAAVKNISREMEKTYQDVFLLSAALLLALLLFLFSRFPLEDLRISDPEAPSAVLSYRGLLLVWLAGSLAALFIGWLLFQNHEAVVRGERRRNLERRAEIQSRRFASLVATASTDIAFLAGTPPAENLLDRGGENEPWRERMEKFFSLLMEHRPHYRGFRFLGERGEILARLGEDSTLTSAISPEALAGVMDGPKGLAHITEMESAPAGIFFTAAIPVHDPKTGEHRGALLGFCSADAIFRTVSADLPDPIRFMDGLGRVRSSGYAPDPSPRLSAILAHPSDRGTFSQDDREFFFSKFRPSPAEPSRTWAVILPEPHLPDSTIREMGKRYAGPGILILICILAPAAVFLPQKISRKRASPERGGIPLPAILVEEGMLLAAILSTLLAIFLQDVLLPGGVASGIPYLLPLFMSSLSARHLLTLLTSVAASFLILAGFFLSRENVLDAPALFNRFLALFAIWLVYSLVKRYRRFHTEEKRRSRELAASEGRMRGLIDSMEGAILLFEESGRVLSASLAAGRIFEIPAPEMTGRDVKAFLPELLPTASPGFRELIPEGGIPVERRTRAALPGGGHITVDVVLSRFALSGGEELFAALVVASAAGIREAEALRVERTELRRRLEESEKFLKLAVGREHDMVELKREIDELRGKLGLPEKFGA